MVSPQESASVWVEVVSETLVAGVRSLYGPSYAPCNPPEPDVADVLGLSSRCSRLKELDLLSQTSSSVLQPIPALLAAPAPLPHFDPKTGRRFHCQMNGRLSGVGHRRGG